MVRVSPLRRKGLRFAAKPDVMPVWEAEVLARSLARYTPLDAEARALAERIAEARAGQEFLDLFGIGDARQWDPTGLWDRLTPAGRLNIPLGKASTGKPLWLDIKEDDEGGVGPHGMLTGITGSGKSKLLRAFVLGLAMCHPPEVLQMLLGDFKGEAEFASLADLPHVVGVVSDLERSQHKLDRFEAVLKGEMMIRAEMLAEAGYESVRDYELARATTRPELPPIGALVIILDEFSQLLRIRPEMAKVFDQVGLQGRSKWIHILNASQRVEQAKMGGLIAQQTYAIGMKVKDAAESRAAIGSARCFEDITLRKAPPGTAFLVVDGEHTKFRSWFTKAPFVPPKPVDQRADSEGNVIGVHRFTAEVSPLPDDIVETDDETSDELAVPAPGIDAPTVESVLVAQIAKHGQGRLKRTMWLPPLDETKEIPLDEMAQEFWGLPWDRINEDGLNIPLLVPYGREDDPLRHTQDLVSLDLSGALGNVAITGATGSGKSTAAATLMMMLAVSHSPQRVQFYGLDFGGGKLARLAGLAHVCGVAGRGADEKIRRVVAEVERVMRFRIRHWEQEGLDVAGFRARKFSGEPVPDDGHGDVFLVIDNLKALKDQAVEIHDRIVALAEGALNYGIHLIVTCDSWISVNMALEAKLRSRIELRLEHTEQSNAVDKTAAKLVPNQPGRGLMREGNHMLVGVPYFRRGNAAEASEQQATERTVTAVTGLWKARGIAAAPTLRVLPARIRYDDLPAAPAGVLKLGVGENEMSMIGVDLERAPHFYATGSSKSGRTTVLRTLLRSIQAMYAPGEAQVIVFDPNYELADAIDERYRVVYASTATDIEAASAMIGQKILGRRPPPGLAPAELAKWRPTGP